MSLHGRDTGGCNAYSSALNHFKCLDALHTSCPLSFCAFTYLCPSLFAKRKVRDKAQLVHLLSSLWPVVFVPFIPPFPWPAAMDTELYGSLGFPEKVEVREEVKTDGDRYSSPKGSLIPWLSFPGSFLFGHLYCARVCKQEK